MSHSTTFKKFVFLLQRARRENLAQAGQPAPISQQAWQQNRRDFLKTAAAGAMVGLMPGLYGHAVAKQGGGRQQIAIIGAGLAGLNAAYQLKKLGLSAEVYEASSRVGGRVSSVSNVLGKGLTHELGGEFINTDHADMLALVQEFGLSLFNRRDDAATVGVPDSAYYLNGRAWSEAELVEAIKPLVDQISRDTALLDQDWDNYAPKFDQYSVSAYLDKHKYIISKPAIRVLFENAIRTEYGAEPAESSALQLLFLLPKVDGVDVDLLGYSDETYTVEGGNALIVDGLRNSLDGQIHTDYKLTKIDHGKNKQYILHFSNGKMIQADIVILAVPFTTLRHIKINTHLPGKLQQFIAQVNLGRNEKVFAGFDERVWRTSPGFGLEAWTDLGFSEVWDGTQRNRSQQAGALCYFLGGDEVSRLNTLQKSGAEASHEFTRRLSRHIPKLLDKSNGTHTRSGWTQNRLVRGAYVNYAPGQLTRFGEYLWIESEDPAERQAVHVDRIVFCGEHLSDEFYGFMNGAAQTGRLAAEWVINLLDKKGVTTHSTEPA